MLGCGEAQPPIPTFSKNCDLSEVEHRVLDPGARDIDRFARLKGDEDDSNCTNDRYTSPVAGRRP
jgi:hypothetical protein